MERGTLAFVLPQHWSGMIGGAEYQARCLLERLVPRQAWNLYYVARNYDPAYLPRGYTIVPVGKPEGYDYLKLHRDTLPLLKELDRLGPSVIYQRCGCAYTGIAAYHARRRGCRMIWHISHDMEVLPHRPRRVAGALSAFLEKKFLEYGVRRCDDIIAQTQYQADCLARYYGRKAAAVVPNFHPSPTEEIDKEGPLAVVWVANLKRWKHPELFLRLARDLEERGSEAKCVMIGAPSGSRSMMRMVEKAAAAVRNLSYLGLRSIEEVNAVLARSHVLVNTSDEEGFANTFIQAWMRRVPVVSLHCNFDSVFTTHRVGFHAGSYDVLLKRVVSLLEDEALRKEMGEEAQRYAAARHSMKNADRLIEILER